LIVSLKSKYFSNNTIVFTEELKSKYFSIPVKIDYIYFKDLKCI
jgi:hypothetical protein